MLGCKGGKVVGNASWTASRRALTDYNEIKTEGSLGENTGVPTCHYARFKDSASVYTPTKRRFRSDPVIVV